MSIFKTIGNGLNSLALQLAGPLHRSAEWGVHICTPIRPGRFGNQEHYGAELICRFVYGAVFLLTAPFTLSLWGVGGFVDKVGDCFKAKNYTHWKGRALEGEKRSDLLFSLDPASKCEVKTQYAKVSK